MTPVGWSEGGSAMIRRGGASEWGKLNSERSRRNGSRRKKKRSSRCAAASPAKPARTAAPKRKARKEVRSMAALTLGDQPAMAEFRGHFKTFSKGPPRAVLWRGSAGAPQAVEQLSAREAVGHEACARLKNAQRRARARAEIAVVFAHVVSERRGPLLHLEELAARERALVARQGLNERSAASHAVGKMTDRQRIGFRRIVFHDHPKI